VKKLLPFLFISIILLACNQEQEDNSVCKNSLLIAGEFDPGCFMHHEFDPPIKILGERVGTDNDFIYNDSVRIDLNFDGADDLQFRYYFEFFQPSCDCEGIDCCMPSGMAFCNVEKLVNIEIASTEFYGIRPDRLEYGDTIDNQLLWIKEGTEYFASAGMGGLWSDKMEAGLMGFRLIQDTDTLYGWIRLNTFSCTKIEISDFVIQKAP